MFNLKPIKRENLLKETLRVSQYENIEELAQNIVWAKMDIPKERNLILKPNHTFEEALEFLNKLNFEYYNGYGIQTIFGVIMLSDQGWLERREYDGSEWWVYKKVPIF